ncbi:cytochrome p450 [Moniliophthora roreri MCA 2997]|uniref:Cytochrome p450 n=1 Tax=Moniliophthora roreri (strain MCA 2997) TaxID=1381753 RepID=V2WHH8_MONRO|nr:cytochrome p450 [Moniliophthora roreri MCA 2997]
MQAIAMILLLLVLSSLVPLALVRSFRRKPYPPGPRSFPIVGNLLQLPASHQWVKFQEWAEQYGPIFHLQAGPEHIVVLNTPELADEFLVKRGRVFSDRPCPHVAADIVSAGQRQLFLPASAVEFKVIRKANHSELGPTPVRQYRRYQELESRVLLHDFVEHGYKSADMMAEGLGRSSDSDFMNLHWFSLVRRFATSVVMIVMYGERVHAIRGNKSLSALYEILENLNAVSLPGSFLADTFTFLQYLPDILAPWRVKAVKMHEKELDLYGGFLKRIEADHKVGINRVDCFVGKYLKAREASTDEIVSGGGVSPSGWIRDLLLTYVAGSAIEAGSDTTASSIMSFILFMLWYPEVLKKAREEVDRVVGSDRLPTFEDEEQLPYVIACIKELLRCRPPTPVGIPHRSSEDVFYNGYFIPKGSLVFGNVWTMQMDPVRFSNPRKFVPERWFTKGTNGKSSGSMKLTNNGPNRDNYTFGWGLRFCQGMHLAEASLFIAISRIIWGLDFEGSIPLDPWDEKNYIGGFAINPLPFSAAFRARTPKHAEIIRRSYEEAQGQWETLGMQKDVR